MAMMIAVGFTDNAGDDDIVVHGCGFIHDSDDDQDDSCGLI